MERTRLARGWWAIVLLTIACSRSPQPWIERLEVDAFEGGEVISLSDQQLRSQLIAQLERSRFKLALDDRKPPAEVKAWRVKLAAGLTEPDLEKHTAAVAVVLELRQQGSSGSFTIDRRRQVKPPAGHDVEAMQAAIRDTFEQALAQAVREAAAGLSLADASSATLHEKLKDGDPAVRQAALRLLVARHDKAALPALLAQLTGDDLDVLRAVMGQLVELRAPEAVNPLIETATRRGPVFQREVIFAIGAIGGPDAEAYLDLVATGHDDPLIRASAEQALSELRARRKPQGEHP
ncbi:MAG: HEAT repeat domain-containing protein [Myxococcota bacterium]